MAPAFDEHRLARRLVAAQVPALARHLAGAREDDIALALRQLHGQLVALVILLEHEHVLGHRRAERMPPHLVWAQGLVRPDIEESPAVGRPRGAVMDYVEHGGEVLPTR